MKCKHKNNKLYTLKTVGILGYFFNNDKGHFEIQYFNRVRIASVKSR